MRPTRLVSAVTLLIATAAFVDRAAAQNNGAAQYVRFQAGDVTSYGIIEKDKIRQIDGDLFGKWRPTDKTHSLSQVKLLVPSARPTQVLALAGNYKSHLGAGDHVTTVTTTTKVTTNAKTGETKSTSDTKTEIEKPGVVPDKFKEPQLFFKSPSSLAAQGEAIVIPPGTNEVHYEAELVIVIGKQAKNVSAADAPKYIFGVTCGNDVSARDWQKGDVQWWRAKGCDTFGPVGPVIATGLDYDNLRLKLRLNGKVVQDESTAQLIHSVPQVVSFVSRHITLHPGDLIFTGTPGRTSAIKPGDSVEVEIEGIGTLTNPVSAASGSGG
jgi:2-keto-4-pentenoate hydratase/2-oxohepta-3-ene-1,7-dioic acid hydratase in catechol pathway